MAPHDADERNRFEARVRAVADLVSRKLGSLEAQCGDTAAGDAPPGPEAMHTLLARPFRASWDFDKKWSNKK